MLNMRTGVAFGIVGVLACWVGVGRSTAVEVVLVENGAAQCTIVTGRDDGLAQVLTNQGRATSGSKPSNVLAEAADDLAEHLNAMGLIPYHLHVHGAGRVRVVREAAEATTKYRILLGTAAIEAYGLREEADALSYAGYIYRTVGNDLLIFGASSKGTANGVYGFLQDELGVRWFGPHELFTVIPSRDQWAADRNTPAPKVSVGALDKRVEPSFYGRNGGHDRPETHGATHRWGRRMRQADGRQPMDQASHNLWRMFPVSRYRDAHPEYYYMTGGERRTYDDWNWGLCWSNTNVIEIAAQQALAHFRAGRFNDSFSLGINDGNAYCECPECVNLQPPRTFRGGRVASDMYYHFVNAVARRTAKEFPDRLLGVIAYNDVTAPPLGPMASNVFVVLVCDIAQHFDADYRRTDEELVRDWEQKGVTLGMYYYLAQGGFTPSYFARHLAAELKDKHRRGFRALINEGSVGAVSSPLGYLDYRLWWDVTLDVDELLDAYFGMLYGPAGAPMQALFELFEEIHMRPRQGGFLYEYNKFPQFRPYTGEDLRRIRGLLADAHAAITGMGIGHSGWEHPEERRLAYTSNGMKVFLNMLEGVVLARELEADTRLDDIETLLRLEKIERLNAILDANDRLYRETLILDAAASFLHRWAGQTAAIRHAWRTHLSDVIGQALVKLYLGVQPVADGMDTRTRQRLGAAVAEFKTDDLREALFAYRTGGLDPGPNRIVNPGFEALAAERPYPAPEMLAKLDWGRSTVHGWAVYPPPGDRISGAFDVSAAEKRSGAQSAVLRGTGNGLYLTVVEGVEAGQVYHVAASVKNTAHVTRVDVPTVGLRVHWLDQHERWTAQGLNSSVESRELDAWLELEQVVRIPDGAAKAVVLVQAGPLHGEETVYIDDVTFRLLR